MKFNLILASLFLLQIAVYAGTEPAAGDTTGSFIKTEVPQPGGQKTGKISDDFWNLELKTMDGKIIKLSDYRGRFVYLNFWGEWCPGCREEMLSIVKAHEKFKDRAKFIGLLKPHDLTKAKQFITAQGMIFPQVILKNKLKRRFNFDGFPLSILIFPDGKTYRRADEVNKIFFDTYIK